MEVEKSLKKQGNDERLQNGFSKKIGKWQNVRDLSKEKRKKGLKKKWKEEQLLKERMTLLQKRESESKKNIPEEISKSAVNYTVSIALPGSILDNKQTQEMKTYLVGQIARAAAVFKVTEIIVFSESNLENLNEEESLELYQQNNSCRILAAILQYMECPQYLRKYYFPISQVFDYVGVLNPLAIPHHLGRYDESKYREGIVSKAPPKEGNGSYVFVGLDKLAVIDTVLEADVRVTLQLDEEPKLTTHYTGKAVSPTAPYKKDGIYWGYTVRLAKNLSEVLSGCPYKGGYDLTIGTSDKGQNVDSIFLPKFKHLLIVFGGLNGLEAALAHDEALSALMKPNDDPSELFNLYLNTCPSQGTKTIRTEEAILITLATLRPGILSAQGIL